ncbi:phage GP46 family protein [Asticcacaulis sp. YBE204]|uniref:phage GP46 family protein n=1 Tax=Asticcacaulis sp. YBE204 TaxID=1282363 RepID=UPI0003C3CDBA|nr:phage GP46 family protein [Asticcacaulis sp. YBE204]ESQ78447.1 hypothetical protein AEYBE204_13290 [Asticcacaulis sp. YBE204]
MTDIALRYEPSRLAFDAFFNGPDFATDDGLYTAVLISLFTDRRANPDDVIPDGTNDPRGWWGDAFATVENDRIGSRLWLLKRSKITAEVLRKAKDYAEEALSWLIEDGVAGSVVVTTEKQDSHIIAIGVVITRPSGDAFKHSYIWSAYDLAA